jgi:hypothetical protein
MNPHFSAALSALRPGVLWVLPGEEILENVQWPTGIQPPTQAEVDAEIAAQTTAKAAAIIQRDALAGLELSDKVALRCLKAGVAFPNIWQVYVQALRGVVRADGRLGVPELPVAPPFPEGT